MHVELFGCTGAGKTTLVAEIERVCRDLGVPLRTGDDVVLGGVGLENLKQPFLRTLFVDVVTLSVCAWTFRKYRPFHRLALRHTMSLRAPALQRINLLRNVLKKIGIFELVSRRTGDHAIVIVDEGTLHAAHNLFVHARAESGGDYTDEFMDAVPLPQFALYAQQSERVLVDRTIARGHRRLPGASRTDVERFIRRAVGTLDAVAASEKLSTRLVRVDLERMRMKPPPRGDDAELGRLDDILRAAIDRLTGNRDT